jgi:hypothetical protein
MLKSLTRLFRLDDGQMLEICIVPLFTNCFFEAWRVLDQSSNAKVRLGGTQMVAKDRQPIAAMLAAYGVAARDAEAWLEADLGRALGLLPATARPTRWRGADLNRSEPRMAV